MRISDWSSDVCSSDLSCSCRCSSTSTIRTRCAGRSSARKASWCRDDGRSGDMSRVVVVGSFNVDHVWTTATLPRPGETLGGRYATGPGGKGFNQAVRSEEHTSELQSLMRISYAVFCLKKKKNNKTNQKQ